MDSRHTLQASSSRLVPKIPKSRSKSANSFKVDKINGKDRSAAETRSNSKRSASLSRKSSHSKICMTENPMQYENSVIYQAAGINDADSKIYKEYDKTGRSQNILTHKANQSGANNLKTKSYRQDSPMQAVVDRFPDKYNSIHQKNTKSFQKDEKGRSKEKFETL